MKDESGSMVGAKSFVFALNAIGIYKRLLGRNEYVLSKQFLRSATSIAEATAGQSRADFITKMTIASKEVREAGTG